MPSERVKVRNFYPIYSDGFELFWENLTEEPSN